MLIKDKTNAGQDRITRMFGEPMGYVDGPNTYQFELSDPVDHLDPTGTTTYSWTIAQALAKLQAQLKDWQAKPGYGLQADLLAHFLGNTGALFKCNDHPADLAQIQNDPDMKQLVNELINEAIVAQDPNQKIIGHQDWDKTKPFKFKVVNDHYFDPSTDLFWAFASLHVVIEGYARETCNGTAYVAKVTFSKNWNFNHGHSWIDNLFPSFDAGQFLEDNGGGKAFGLNGWYHVSGEH